MTQAHAQQADCVRDQTGPVVHLSVICVQVIKNFNREKITMHSCVRCLSVLVFLFSGFDLSMESV